jgi:hypothetical protein
MGGRVQTIDSDIDELADDEPVEEDWFKPKRDKSRMMDLVSPRQTAIYVMYLRLTIYEVCLLPRPPNRVRKLLCNLRSLKIQSSSLNKMRGTLFEIFWRERCWNIRRLCERAQCAAIPGISVHSFFLLFSFILRAVGPYLSFSAFIL